MQTLNASLHWIFSDGSLAIATWGLVVATFLLYLDGRQRSKEQNRKWNEDRKREKQESLPSAVVEIAAKEEMPLDMYFACFNLGNNSFFVDRMIVTATDGTRSESNLTPQVVVPGTWVTAAYNRLQGIRSPAVLLRPLCDSQAERSPLILSILKK